jgi:hypothetical protein
LKRDSPDSLPDVAESRIYRVIPVTKEEFDVDVPPVKEQILTFH